MSERKKISEHISLRAPNEVIRELDKIAAQRGATRSRVIVDALRRQFDIPTPNVADAPTRRSA